nr:Fe-S cluster assembly protein HesB [Limosilactobacillus rudii]
MIITDNASQWFKKNLNLVRDKGVKFYGKTVQPHNVKHSPEQGFAVENELERAIIVTAKDGINYHVNFDDGWFFSGMIVTVDYVEDSTQPTFNFKWEHDGNEDVDASTGASSKYEEYWE